jgi:hypothetical protein
LFLSSLSTALHQHNKPQSLAKAYPATAPNEPSPFDKPGGVRDLQQRTSMSETWHPAQHVRQLMLLRRDDGIEPDGPLSEADFAGLPIPKKVWDDEAA